MTKLRRVTVMENWTVVHPDRLHCKLDPAGDYLLVPVEPYINALFDALCESEGYVNERLLEHIDTLMAAIGEQCQTCGGGGKALKFGNKVYVEGPCPDCNGTGWVVEDD